MAGRTIQEKTRELAYTVWRQCGQNMEQTLKALNDVHGFVLSKPTLYDWQDKYQWKERAARAEAEEKKAEGVSEESKLLLALDSQRAKYDRYFDSLPENTVDNQAVYAYTSLIKAIVVVKKHSASGLDDPQQDAPEEILHAIKTPQDAIAALQLAVEKKVNTLLTQKNISLPAIKDLQKAMEMIEKMKERYKLDQADAEEKPQGLSDDMADDIRKKILGLEQ